MATVKELRQLGLSPAAIALLRAKGWRTADHVQPVDAGDPQLFPKGTRTRTKQSFLSFVDRVLAARAAAIAAYDAQVQAQKRWQAEYRRRLNESVDFTMRLRFRLPDLPCDALAAEDAEKFIVGVLRDYLASHPDPRYRRARVSATQFERSYGNDDDGSTL